MSGLLQHVQGVWGWGWGSQGGNDEDQPCGDDDESEHDGAERPSNLTRVQRRVQQPEEHLSNRPTAAITFFLQWLKTSRPCSSRWPIVPLAYSAWLASGPAGL